MTDLSGRGTVSCCPHSAAPVFGKLTFRFLTSWTAFQTALPLIFTLLLVDMFDNIGTLIGVTKRAGLLDAHGRLPKAGRALLADSIATILSALCGTSTVVSYIESASGVEAGGRTGLTAIWVAIFMLAALFLTPLILAIPACATAPALVIVGIFMMQSVVEIDMTSLRPRRPPSSRSSPFPSPSASPRASGSGSSARCCSASASGKARTVPPIGYAVAAMFFLSFFRIWPFQLTGPAARHVQDHGPARLPAHRRASSRSSSSGRCSRSCKGGFIDADGRLTFAFLRTLLTDPIYLGRPAQLVPPRLRRDVARAPDRRFRSRSSRTGSFSR